MFELGISYGKLGIEHHSLNILYFSQIFLKLSNVVSTKFSLKLGFHVIFSPSPTSFLGTWSKPLLGLIDPLIGEAMVLPEGVIVANLHGFKEIVLETGCVEVVNLWNTRHDSRLVVVPIFLQIGEFCNSFDFSL